MYLYFYSLVYYMILYLFYTIVNLMIYYFEILKMSSMKQTHWGKSQTNRELQ